MAYALQLSIMKTLFSIFGLLSLVSASAVAQPLAGTQPHIPLGASWGMTLEQVQQLPALERTKDGALSHAYTIHSVSQTELVARWQGRTVSLFVTKDLGLYAINIEMTPQTIQHTPDAADPEALDLEQCAPIRLAIMRKYGSPSGLAITWDAQEHSPLPASPHRSAATEEEEASRWPYARNWLLWEGPETRLALGEQSVWYVSRLGLAQRERNKRERERERDLSFSRELERRAKRQQQIDAAREAVPSRAQSVAALF
ncbi:MAG TPA: hypothetical protein VNN62_04140 [Methylomirabilota bacterium]|nr:hypothetical protein [Methylomirabilota bacterium]